MTWNYEGLTPAQLADECRAAWERNNTDNAMDKAIAEQARYYGLTVEQYAKATRELADLQTVAEFNCW